MELYQWQKECLQVWKQNKYHGIAQVVTGAGKTIMAIHAIMQIKAETDHPLRVRIIVPTNALAAQWSKQLKQNIPDITQVGFYGGGRYDDPSQDYMIYVINSARYNLSKHILQDWKEGYGVFLICDECHHYGSTENKKIFEFLDHKNKFNSNYYSLGLSATPYIKHPDGRKIVLQALGNVIYQYGFTQANMQGTVCPFAVFQTRITLTADEADRYADLTLRIMKFKPKLYTAYPLLKTAGEDFFELLQKYANEEDEDGIANMYLNLIKARREIVLFANNRFTCAIALIQKLRQDEKIIIFSERISQAEEMLGYLKESNINHVSHYHSELTSEARKRNLEDFKNGTNRILVCCKGLDEGADIPEASIGIILSGTNTSRQRIQRLGRILRTYPNKTIASLYYLYVNEANEDPAYLPNNTNEIYPICSISYNNYDNTFIHNAYEETCMHLLRSLKRNNKLKKEFLEFRTCLEEGNICSDWLLTEQECQKHYEKAELIHEKNYWKAMNALSKVRQQLQNPENQK